MSKLACWELIKQGCNASQLNAESAAQNQADALYYEDEIQSALSDADQATLRTLVDDVVTASNRYRNKTELLRQFLRDKAMAAEGA